MQRTPRTELFWREMAEYYLQTLTEFIEDSREYEREGNFEVAMWTWSRAARYAGKAGLGDVQVRCVLNCSLACLENAKRKFS